MLQCPWYCLRKMVLHTDWFVPNSGNHTERATGLWWSGSCYCHINHGWWWGVILVWPAPSLLCGGLPKRTVGPWMRFGLGMPRIPRLPLMAGSKALFAYADTWITNCKTVAPSMWTNVMTSSSQVLVFVGFLSNFVFDIPLPMIASTTHFMKWSLCAFVRTQLCQKKARGRRRSWERAKNPPKKDQEDRTLQERANNLGLACCRKSSQFHQWTSLRIKDGLLVASLGQRQTAFWCYDLGLISFCSKIGRFPLVLESKHQ